MFRQAEKYFERADYLKAFHLYAGSLEYDTSNYMALYKSGLSLFSISKTDSNATAYFLKTRNKIPEAHFYLGRIYQLNGKCEKALEEFYYFRTANKEGAVSDTEIKEWIKKCEGALLGEAEKENYTVKNLGSTINTQYPEYVPLIWKLNNSLIFTSRREGTKNKAVDPYGKYYEDIYISYKTHLGWSAPVSLSDTLNTETHDACVAFSPKTNELIIYRTDEQKTGGDLYSTEYSPAGWSTPIKLGTEINSEYLEASACFSNNGSEILFSSNRPGGHGGKDLYRVVRFMNGKYSLPKNLGPEINTAEDEDAPFIDNGRSLYFSSKGHNSIGEYDIFKCHHNADKDTWEKPVNLGQPINSTNDDIYFTKQDDKNTAYFTSRRDGGYGDADIYEVNFSEPNKIIVYCTIKSTDVPPEELKDIQVSLIDSKTGKLEGLYQPNANMNMVLLVAKNNPYDMKVEGDRITPIDKQVTFNESTREITIELHTKQE